MMDPMYTALDRGETLYEIDPGQHGSPFRLHHAKEELIIVLAGRPTLRTLEGPRTP
jgi:uncharacterized cupin superfamily protein